MHNPDATIAALDAVLRNLDGSVELWFEDGEFFAQYDGEIIPASSLSALLEEIVK